MKYDINEQVQKNAKFACIECHKEATAEEWDDATRKAVADNNIVPIVYGADEDDSFYYCPHCGLENWGKDLK